MPRPAPRIELEQFVMYRLSVLSGTWDAASGRFYRRFGLALREWRVLAVLSTLDGRSAVPASEIVRLTAVEKAGVSRALAALERRGLVLRTDSDQDGRRSEVELTAAGRALLRKLAPAAMKRQAGVVSVFTPAERAAFFRLLEKLEARVAQLSRR